MAKLIVLQGCPCSGKTTWRKQYVTQNPETIVACLDDIRVRLGNGKYSFDTEKQALKCEDYIVNTGLECDKEVIVDATNLNPKIITKWKETAKKHNCEIEFKEFYIPITEAIKRSKKRKAEGDIYISKKAMFEFYQTYYPNEFVDNRVIKNRDTKLKDCVICDLDGTLALHTGRHPFEWNKIETDKIDPRLKTILTTYMFVGIKVFFVTGRPNEAKEATVNWLIDNGLTLTGKWQLFTREDNDRRPSEEYKKEIYETHILNQYNVISVFEDHTRCVEMYRSLGLLTCQVATLDY